MSTSAPPSTTAEPDAFKTMDLTGRVTELQKLGLSDERILQGLLDPQDEGVLDLLRQAAATDAAGRAAL